MQPSLGKMSAYEILNWRDQAAGTTDEIVAAFLRTWRSHRYQVDRDPKGCSAAPDGAGRWRIGSDLHLR